MFPPPIPIVCLWSFITVNLFIHKDLLKIKGGKKISITVYKSIGKLNGQLLLSLPLQSTYFKLVKCPCIEQKLYRTENSEHTSMLQGSRHSFF